MNKPEPPKKIDSFPLPKPPEGKKPEAKKTGWEPPSPQKQRAIERKLGMLLAVCLLVALGYVAYRKFDAKRHAPDAGDQLTKFEKMPPEANGEKLSTDAAAAGPLSLADLHQHAAQNPAAELSSESTPAQMTFANAMPPEQSEPGTGSAGPVTSSTPTFDLRPSDPTAQSEPESTAAGESSNPFFVATDTTEPDAGPAVEGSDPFASREGAVAEPGPSDGDSTAISSDESSQFGAPADVAIAQPGRELTFGDPPSQSAQEPAAATDALSTPVVGLFGIESAEAATGDQNAQPETTTPSPTSSPWGDGAAAATAATTATETEPPQLIEPVDPQVMPTLTLGPFDTAASDPPSASEPTAAEPTASQPAGSGFNPFPESTVETQVHQRHPAETPAENAFATGGGTTVVERSTNAMQDPFAPARDVSHAIREDEVLIHQVQTGDNFWSIAKQHYGSGKCFTALAAYNQSRFPDPRRIRPGMQVQVPSEAVLAQQFPQLVSGSSNVPYTAPPAGPNGFSLNSHGRPQYRVAKGDTLSGIAERHLGRASRWRQVYGMNSDQLPSADSLTTGMVLRLPADATQIRMDAAGFSGR